MTISAQQSQISFVCIPILETSRPRIHAALGFDLASGVNVVNIKRPEIIKTAFNALAAKLLNQSEFTFPISWAFMNAVAVLVPVISQTVIRTKTVGALLTTRFAFTGFFPTMSEIAGLPAKLRPGMFASWFATLFTSIHGSIIPTYFLKLEQGGLFDDAPA